jgi:hypothetical protein
MGYLSVFIILHSVLLKTTSIKTVMPDMLNVTDLKEQNKFRSLKQLLFLVITKTIIEAKAFLGMNFICVLQHLHHIAKRNIQ